MEAALLATVFLLVLIFVWPGALLKNHYIKPLAIPTQPILSIRLQFETTVSVTNGCF